MLRGYAALGPEEKREYHRQASNRWKMRNRKRMSEYARKWARKNRARSRQLHRDEYRRNRKNHLTRTGKWYIKFREVIIAAKSVPCMDCGRYFPPAAMDFDHVRGEKLFTVGAIISKMGGMVAIEAAQEEIKKCDIVCANCHRIRTAQRKKERLVPCVVSKKITRKREQPDFLIDALLYLNPS